MSMEMGGAGAACGAVRGRGSTHAPNGGTSGTGPLDDCKRVGATPGYPHALGAADAPSQKPISLSRNSFQGM